MFLVIGLGNPGQKYQQTRHNAGFMAIHALGEKYDFPAFRLDKKSNSLISEGFINNEKLILAKPQTFMNNSGTAVKSLYTKYKILDTRYLILVHDDIDLPVGTIRISTNSGSAGHKGIDSIINAIGTKNFTRIRIGILPKPEKPKNVDQFVLKKFTKEENEIIEQTIESSTRAIEMLLKEGLAQSMNEFNK